MVNIRNNYVHINTCSFKGLNHWCLYYIGKHSISFCMKILSKFNSGTCVVYTWTPWGGPWDRQKVSRLCRCPDFPLRSFYMIKCNLGLQISVWIN